MLYMLLDFRAYTALAFPVSLTIASAGKETDKDSLGLENLSAYFIYFEHVCTYLVEPSLKQ